jgi:nucleoside-diphosphate-sugar epimerase
MLSFARLKNAKFLLASTSEVYGDPLEHPQKETYWGNVNPIGIRSCYDESKRVAEAITMSFVRAYGTDARIIRIFNTYGPRMRERDGRFISNFIFQALRNEPLTIYGDGLQTRSTCYVSDLMDGICRAMFREGTTGEVFNLGNPEERTVLEVAEMIKRLIPTNSEIIFSRPLPKDDPLRRKPDISKARERLGFEPHVSLEEGLATMIEYFKQCKEESECQTE